MVQARARFLIVTLCLIGVVGGSAIWYFSTPLKANGLAAVGNLSTMFPEFDGHVWWESHLDCEIEGYCGSDPAPSCSHNHCEGDWYASIRGNDVYARIDNLQARVRFVADQFSSQGNAMWAFYWDKPQHWVPWNTDSVGFPDPDTSASDTEINCYYNPYAGVPSVNGDGCVWEYWARYGQYVVGLSYGSERNPISLDEFQRLYVQPTDRRVAELLGA